MVARRPGVLRLCDPVAFAFEAPAIATGFPFGFFAHDGPGPELLGVPPTVLPWPSRLAVPAWPNSDQHREETSLLRVSHLRPVRLLFPVSPVIFPRKDGSSWDVAYREVKRTR